MASQKSIKLYVYVDGVNDVPFYGTTQQASGINQEQIEIEAFKYDAKRMGGTPSVTCTLKYPQSLDSLWSKNIYCLFNNEKFFLRQIPSSSKSNTEDGYSYSLEFVSERDILNNVYMYDAVIGNKVTDNPVSNSTKFSFFGNIQAFADRINSSLQYSKLQTVGADGTVSGYQVKVDEGIDETLLKEERFVSFENTFFSNAIQEIYNTYQIPYYFKGKEIHIGLSEESIDNVFRYGVDYSLLSIKKDNANNKVVNRATGFGSSENIPYYYPNNSPKGDIGAVVSEGYTVKILNYERYADKIAVDETITYKDGVARAASIYISNNGNAYNQYTVTPIGISLINQNPVSKWFKVKVVIENSGKCIISAKVAIDGGDIRDFSEFAEFVNLYDENMNEIPRTFDKEDGYFNLGWRNAGTYYVVFGMKFPYLGRNQYTVTFTPETSFVTQWEDKDGNAVQLSDIGLSISPYPKAGTTITQKLIRYINPVDNLMPSKYRETEGSERFYEAVNGEYKDKEGNDIIFNNPYVEGRPSENIVEVEDIKPTIKEMLNSLGQRIDMFSEVAYDEPDNDDTSTDSEGNATYQHPHFFAKLRKLPFNLFDCALESGDMTFSITSGSCGACNFKLKVDGEYPYKNTVQVDSEGNLLRDSNGRVLCGLDGYQSKVTPQARQQDTVNNEVWIALEKEEETYGILMPKAPKYNEAGELLEAGYRVKGCTDGQDNGDTFVILNILLPDAYILAAEKKLEQEIIRDMKENNDERFNFSITFSSIFFEEHPEILALLNENSKLKIEYNGEEITQYVSSFSYSMSAGNALPTISVELSDSLTVAQNALKNTIQQVKMSVKESIDNAAQIARTSYISKESNDVANGVVDFRRGVKFGDGGQVEIDENNNTKLIIDFLTVNKKALFKALDIQDAHHIGGEILISPASMLCNKVEELADVYRCYFQDYDDKGNQIFNTFVVNDQAYCKTLNTWGTTYYWRLVIAVGSNYIDLSKSVCDENSDAPREGDKIIQLGYRNTDDNSRKSAIKISSYGENTPSFVMYTGIDSFSLEGKEIHGTIYRKNNGEYEAYFYNYGSMLLGDPKKEKDYIEFDAVKGEFEIKANVKFKSSQSLQGITDYDNLKNGQDELNQGIIDLGTSIQGQIENLQTQIDGAIETWFYEGVPTLSNTPAVDWTDNDTRNKHLGDLYYDQTTGKCYRFQMDDASNYIWREITDTSIKAALDAANKAQETADGKMKVFVAQPKDSDSYQVGDLWVNATYGSEYSNDLLKCKTAKAKDTAFSISHWEKATKYTDDSEINKYAYLKAQLQETSIEGGLILTSLISLGMNEESGGGMTHTTYSGISGVYDSSKSGGGIAAWYGGDMVDAFDYANADGVLVVPSNIRAAKSLFRFDGTGYLASGNITWDANGYGQMGGVGDNYALKWDATGVRIGANIKIGAGDETVQMLANLLNMFELDTTSVAGKTLIHAKYDGLYSDGDIAAGGAFAGTPSGGGKTYLNELLDVQLATSSLNVGDMLMWNGAKYVNIPQSSITPDLSKYATQQWVLDKKYLTSVPVTSVVGQTGNITAAQVATALTDAGYKLTDTTYELATTTSNGLMSATDKKKLNGIAENANNYTLPTASSTTKGGIKVGTTLSISGEVLDLKSGFPKGTYTKVQIDDYGRVESGSTLSASDIPSLPWSKITSGKPTTISGYGITDAYTKTETDNKVAALQSLLDSMFERVYDSNNKLIRIHSNVTISSSGDLVAGGSAEGGGTSGGAYTQLEWNAIKALTQSESGLLASAYAVKEAYNELNIAIEALAGKATNVKFTQTLTSGKKIGSISIDGKSTSLFSPANYAWSEVTGKPTKLSQFTDDVVSGKYLPLSGGTMSNTNVVTNLNADLLDGYNADSFTKRLYLGTTDLDSIGDSLLGQQTGSANATPELHYPVQEAGGLISILSAYNSTNQIYGTHNSNRWFARGAGTGLSSRTSWREFAFLDSNVASSSKWANPRTITLTGSVTGSVSIDGSADVSLVTTTNHTHTFDSLTSKPTTISGYGIADAVIFSTDIDITNHDKVANIGYGYTAKGWASSGPAISFGVNANFNHQIQANVSSGNLVHRNVNGGTPGSWYEILDAANYGSYALPLSGGTLSGSIRTLLTLQSSNSMGPIIDLKSRSGDSVSNLGHIPSTTDYGTFLSNIEGQIGLLLSNDGVAYLTKNTNYLYKTYTILHSGNYNSYAPKLDGTGASGTWGISISGNAATATYTKSLDSKSLPSSKTNAANTVWCKFARITVNSAWSVASGYLFFGGDEATDHSAILHYHFRASSTDTTLGFADLIWLVKSNDTISVIAVKAADNIYDLYVNNLSTYVSPRIYHMSATSSRFSWSVGSWTTTKPTAAYTASDSGRVHYASYSGSATKLETARTIWGQSFNGTGNVSGALTGVTTITTSGQICINTSSSQANNYNEGIRCNLGGSSNWASIVLGGASGSNTGTGSGVYSLLVNSSLFRIRQNSTEVLCINTSNNVGIGTVSPSYKLHVVGTGYYSGNVIVDGDFAFSGETIGKHPFAVINTNSSNYAGGFDTTFPNQPTTSWNSVISAGVRNSTNDKACINFGYRGQRSTNNFLGLGFYGNDNIITILASQNVGIGTTSPSGKLTVNGAAFLTSGTDNNYSFIRSSNYSPNTARLTIGTCYGYSTEKLGLSVYNGCVGIGATATNGTYTLNVDGTAYATENIIAAGDITAGSDIRYKDKVQDLGLSVHDIALAPAFTYKWNNREDDALVHIGSSAQYWLNTDAKDAVYYDKQNDFYHLNYASLALCNTIILARGMETQEEKIARLEERINELENKLRQYDSCR